MSRLLSGCRENFLPLNYPHKRLSRQLLTFELSSWAAVARTSYLWTILMSSCRENFLPLNYPHEWLSQELLTFELSSWVVVVRTSYLWTILMSGCRENFLPLNYPHERLSWELLTFELSSWAVVVRTSYLWTILMSGCRENFLPLNYPHERLPWEGLWLLLGLPLRQQVVDLFPRSQQKDSLPLIQTRRFADPCLSICQNTIRLQANVKTRMFSSQIHVSPSGRIRYVYRLMSRHECLVLRSMSLHLAEYDTFTG